MGQKIKGMVLIGDDDPKQLENLMQEIRQLGYEATVVSQGAAIYAMVRKLRPDLVILDTGLNNTDVWQIAGKLQADLDTRHIPVIMVNSLDTPKGREHALVYGCIDYLQKPHDPDKLKDRLDLYIAQGRFKRKASEMLDKL